MSKHFYHFFFLTVSMALIAEEQSLFIDDVPTKEFDLLVESTLMEMNIPGAAIGVIKDGNILLMKGYGLRNVEAFLPVTTKTQFPVGSVTKSFTTFLLGMLKDEGVLDWDDKVVDRVPYFKLKDPMTTYEITLRDYLSHRSGYPKHDAAWLNVDSREEMIHRLRYLDPIHPFRSHFLYQNIGYMVAAHAAEIATGTSYEELIRQRIFVPLKMKSANFSLKTMKESGDYSEGYRESNKTVYRTPCLDMSIIAPAAGINAHLEDMLIWLNTLLKNGDLFINPETWNEIISPQMLSDLVCNKAYDVRNEILMESYGLGWVIASYRNHIATFHGGNPEGFSSSILFFPKENLGIVVLCNKQRTPFPYVISTIVSDVLLGLPSAGWLEKCRKFTDYNKDAFTKLEEGAKTIHHENTETSHPLNDYQGVYINPGYGEISVLAYKDSLEARLGNMIIPLSHWHYDVFEVSEQCEYPFFKGIKFNFHENVYGDIHSIDLPIEPDASDIVFIKQKDAALFKNDYLDRFVGNYSFHGFGFKIERIDGELVVKAFGRPPYYLLPERLDLFKVRGMDNYSVQFLKDEENAVTAIQLTQGDTVFVAYKT